MSNFPSHMPSSEASLYLGAIIDSSEDAIIGKTLDGIILFWNKSAERIFGYTSEEAVGQHINLIIPKERRDEEFVIIGKIRQGQRIEHFETIRQAKDGHLVELALTVSPIKNESGKIIGASKIARDISAVKSGERANAYLAAIIDSSDDAIISKDLNGVITSWNKSAERIFGYTPEEAIGQHISLLIPPEKIDEESVILSKVKSGQRVDHFETQRRTKSGDLVEISLTVSPILDGQGVIMGASKVARDITRQRSTEAALVDMSRRKDEFLANISHELRTPMNAVIGLAHILGLSKTMSDKERQYVRTLKTSADSLLLLINNLLDFSKIETGALELEEVEFSLPDVIEKTRSLLQLKAEEKKLSLATRYEGAPMKYYVGDPLRIQQVLTNLIGNAIKFTEAGSVEVIVRSEEHDDDTTLLNIDIKDTGIGISDDKLNAIFDKFIQADASMTRKYGGSGLGLSISRGLVERMGGTISVRSTVGLGTTFTVRLPLMNSGRDARVDVGSDEIRARVHKNVLIVDDYEPNLIVAEAILENLGYNYDTAENGIVAIRRFQQSSYDVILMDVQMHDMDGFESTRQIREMELGYNLPRTPIIAMTAHVLEQDKDKCIEAGMDEFIPKPFDPAVLEKILTERIAGRT